MTPVIYSPAELAKRIKSDNAFVKRVLEQPKIWLTGGEDDLRLEDLAHSGRNRLG